MSDFGTSTENHIFSGPDDFRNCNYFFSMKHLWDRGIYISHTNTTTPVGPYHIFIGLTAGFTCRNEMLTPDPTSDMSKSSFCTPYKRDS